MQSFIVLVSLVAELAGGVILTPLNPKTLPKPPQSFKGQTFCNSHADRTASLGDSITLVFIFRA